MSRDRETVPRNTALTRLYHWGAVWLLVGTFVTGFGVWPFRIERWLSYHQNLGWAVAVWGALGLLRPRAIGRFLAGIARFTRRDLVWLARFPLAVGGRGSFPRHEGVLDPGQRLAAWVIILLAGIGVGSGTAMMYTCDPVCGQAFVVSLYAHRGTQIALAVVLIGHVIVSAGVLPGYRGVWRAMHGSGRVPVEVARRLWPAWTERRLDEGDGG